MSAHDARSMRLGYSVRRITISRLPCRKNASCVFLGLTSRQVIYIMHVTAILLHMSTTAVLKYVWATTSATETSNMPGGCGAVQ